jgi:hypothetical protein
MPVRLTPLRLVVAQTSSKVGHLRPAGDRVIGLPAVESLQLLSRQSLAHAGSAQCVNRRSRDDPFDAPRQFRVEGHERVRLQQRQCDVLGVVRRRPAELIRQLSGAAPEHGVTEEPDRHSPDALEVIAGEIGGDLAPLDGLVQSRQRLGAKERGCEELVWAPDLDFGGRQVEDGAGVDNEPRHQRGP